MAKGSTITPMRGRPARTVYPFDALKVEDFFYDGKYTDEKSAKMRSLVQQYYRRNGKDKMFAVGNDGKGWLLIKRIK